MDKYAGIERADGEVYQNAVVIRRRKESGSLVGLLIRWVAAAVLVCIAFAGKWIERPWVDKVTDSVRSIICYDLFARDDLGAVPAFDTDEEEKTKA